MKKTTIFLIVSLPILSFFIGCKAHKTDTDSKPTNEQIIGNSVKIGNLEISQYDFPNAIYWEDAKNACPFLGNDWRLPYKEELDILYENKDRIGGFSNDGYWCDMQEFLGEGDVDGIPYKAWEMNFSSGRGDYVGKNNKSNVRAVRTCQFQPITIIGASVKIGNLEIAQYDFPQELFWKEAIIDCASLGAGWRMPTKDELNNLFKTKDNIGGFKSWHYWSSTEVSNDNAWSQDFNGGLQYHTNCYEAVCRVRAVRDF